MMMGRESGFTIVGAGGIACALGHALLSGGIDATIVETDEEKLAWGREHGIGLDQEPAHRAELLHFDKWYPRKDDLVLLCTKCYDNRAVLDRTPDGLKLIPVQNGFDAQLVGRVEIEGIASLVTECILGRTHTRFTRPGDLHKGFSTAAQRGKIPDRVEIVISVLEKHARFSVRRVPEVLPSKNTKLLHNAAISPIAAIAGLNNGELLTIPKARMLAFPFSRTLKGTYCSMAGDLPNGPTELDNYNGYLLKLAGARQFPLNQQVDALAKYVEQNGLPPGRLWLDELLARIQAP